MEELTKMDLTKVQGLGYDLIVRKWDPTWKDSNPFEGHFLVRLTSELSSIEGIRVSYNMTREIFENEQVKNYSGDIRSLYSVLNNREVAKYLNSILSAGTPISVPVILETHRLLMFGSIDNHSYSDNGERAGTFRKHNYCVGRYDVGADASEVPKLVQELCELIQGLLDDGCNVLKVATVFHCHFEHIHPFCDGSGRVGRWLLNYFLVLNGHPPIIIDSERKQDYYKGLELFDRDEDYERLYTFLKAATISTYSSWKYMLGVD